MRGLERRVSSITPYLAFQQVVGWQDWTSINIRGGVKSPGVYSPYEAIADTLNLLQQSHR